MGAVGDQGEGQEAFAGAGVFGLEGQAAQVAERLSPFLHLDADHRRPSPGWPVHPKLLSFSKITRRTVLGNSWFLEDLGIKGQVPPDPDQLKDDTVASAT